MSDFLMLSLSNGDEPSQRTYDQLSRSVGSLGKVQPVKVPELLIGTLDSLMTCSEDLQKADNQIRQICSAVARTHDEVARAIGKEAKVGPLYKLYVFKREVWVISTSAFSRLMF